MRKSSVWLGLALVAVALQATEPLGPAGGDGVWITLEEDAFVELDDFRFGGEPLSREAAAPPVVLTRVHEADLQRISERLHRTHHRCAGFVAHASLERARLELERVATGRPSGTAEGTFTIDQSLLVKSLEAAVDESSIVTTIDGLSNEFSNRFHSNPVGSTASQWIHDRWLALAAGRSDVSVELYPHAATIQPSVILTIRGVGLPDEVVVLGGHLDSISFDGGNSGDPAYLAPGADDDGSGIAVLTEVIRIAMAHGYRPNRTVQFIGYAAEEVGLVGSGEIADAYQAAGVDVVAVLQLDMTDYFGSVEDIGVLSENWTDPTLTSFVIDLIEFYQPELQWVATACGYACSDHASWDSRGYPAAMPFEARVGQHNPNIHTVDDTLAFLGNDAAHAAKFARLATAFMVEVAKVGDVDIFADGFETGTTERWSTVVP